MEYYASMNNGKYLHFKQKMLLVLNKANVISALNNHKIATKHGESDEGINFGEKLEVFDENKENKEADFSVKVLKMKKNHMLYENQMKNLFESNENDYEKKIQLIDHQLNSQAHDIQERIQERRNSVYFPSLSIKA